MKDSGLRGRGGAGFPTGVKWGVVRAHHAFIYVRGEVLHAVRRLHHASPRRRLKFWTLGRSSTLIFTSEHLDVPLDFESTGAAESMLSTRAL